MDWISKATRSPGVRRAGAWALRAVGPLVLAFLLLRVVDYGEFRDVFQDINYAWIAAAVACVQGIILLRTLRWMELHASFGLRPAPFFYQLRLSYATNLATLVLPQLINPLSRLVLLMQDGYRTGRSLAASVSEKLLDFASYLAFGLAGSIALASIFGGMVWWAAGLAIATVAGLMAAYAFRGHLSDLATWVLARVPGTGSKDGDRAETIEEILSLDRVVAARLLAWSMATSLTQATMVFFITRAVGVDVSYGFMLAVWGIIALSLLLPISVNGVGTREAVLATAFHAADKSTDAAVAIGLLTLAVVAVGSSPGLIEWLRRFFFGGYRPSESELGAPLGPVSS
jgi:uncharacterized membrane protein YbhN (UPF0104 family)